MNFPYLLPSRYLCDWLVVNFSEICRFTEPLKSNKTGVSCPECKKGELVAKRSRRGIFYACDQYPDCKFALSDKPTGEKCPICSSLLVENKKGKIKCSQKNCPFEKN